MIAPAYQGLTPLPMNSSVLAVAVADRRQRVSGFRGQARADVPLAPSTASGRPRIWLLSVERCPRPLRDGDGLGGVIYGLGSGLSWNPIAIAFRSSAFNTLVFIFASYSSIDWVTYSSPYLSIL